MNDILSDYTKTIEEIAKILGCHPATVCRKRKKLGITGPRGTKLGSKKSTWGREKTKREIRFCKSCNTEFECRITQKREFCSLSCASKSRDTSYMQSEEYRNLLSKDSTPEYRRFRNRVTSLSEKVYRQNKELLNPDNHIRARCGVEGAWQLDHIMSVRECFEKGLTPEETSRLENLQLLPWKKNLSKR